MIRWFFARFFPALFGRMKAESQTWKMCCPECGHEVSVWEAGGIRYKAAGEPVRRMRCMACGEVSAMRVRRRRA